MSNIVKILPYSVDLDKTIEKTEMHTLFLMGDKNAHRIELTVTRSGKPVDLTGCIVTGFFSSPKNKTTFQLDGALKDGKANVTLNEQCYTLHGLFWMVIQITGNDVDASLFCGEGFMRASRTETIVYDDYIIYDVDTLLGQISAMRQATDNANEAAAAANDAAAHAPYIGGNGNWYAWDVGLKAYVDTGEKAAGPQGPSGDTPYIGSNGNWWIGDMDTGTPARGPQGANGTGSGTVTGVTVGGVTYEPDDTGVVDLGKLGGGAGIVTGVKVGGETKQPDEAGVVDLGSLGTVAGVKVGGETKQPDNTGVVDLGELGGTGINVLDVYPVGSIYMSVNSTDPSELFGGWWEQLEDRFLLGAGANYAAGTTGGEAKHKLTVAELASHFHKTYVYSPQGSGQTSCPSQSAQAYVERSTTATGGDQPHNNMPPYLVVYMWKRIEDQEVA